MTQDVGEDFSAGFYAEWSRRAPGSRRSLRRAALLAEATGASPSVPVLTVVGSKGKGTAAVYASAWLAAARRRVVTVTSPGLRTDAERVRVDGVAVSPSELAALGRRLGEAARVLPPEPGGYLSPSGLFTLAGILHARAVGADVIVLEAGMGGASDEAGLFPPDVVAITEVFGEHLGVLGDTPARIAADKAGVVAETTSAVVSLPQTPEVAAAIAAVVPGVEVMTGPPLPPDLPLPPGLGRANAALGCLAALRLLGALGRTAPAGRLRRVLSSVRLPGRTSWHEIPGATLLVDSAVTRAGAAAALAEARTRWDRIDHVLVCLPDHKDVPGVLAELDGLPVTRVRMPDRESLAFTLTEDGVEAAALTRESLAALGRRVVVLGTVYFTGRILDLIDAPAERVFEA
jgi:folylpolyglutamate synthase/dihydropteroate synthase